MNVIPSNPNTHAYMTNLTPLDHFGLKEAIEQAKKSYSEGGIPIGSTLVSSSSPTPKVLGSGHNERVQLSNPILHGEMSALQQAGRLRAGEYQNATMVCRLKIHYDCMFSPSYEVHNIEVAIKLFQIISRVVSLTKYLSQPMQHVYRCHPPL